MVPVGLHVHANIWKERPYSLLSPRLWYQTLTETLAALVTAQLTKLIDGLFFN